MRIRSLRVDGFGSLSDKTFIFRPGLQVYFGPNEAGKTTLVTAATAGLYGWDARRRRDRELSTRYKPWHVESYGLAVELECEGSIYRIARDFGTQTAEAFVSQSGEWHPVSPASALEAAIGIQDESLFRSLLVFSQTEVGELDRKRVGEAMAAKLAGAGDDVSGVKAVDLLRKRLSEVTKKGQTVRTEGELQSVKARIRDLEGRLSRTDQTSADLLARKAEVDLLEAEFGETEMRLASLVPIVERWTLSRQARERLGDAEEQQKTAEAKLRRLTQLRARLGHIEKVLEAYVGRIHQFTGPVREAVEDAERRRSQAVSVLEERGRAKMQIERELERSRRQLRNASISLEGLTLERYSDEQALEVEAASSRAFDAEQGLQELDVRLRASWQTRNLLRARSTRCFVVSVVVLVAGVSTWVGVPALGWAPLVLGGLVSAGLIALSAQSHLAAASEAAGSRALGAERRRCEESVRDAIRVLDAVLVGETLDEYRENRRRSRRLAELRLQSEQAVAAQEYSLDSVDVASAEAVFKEEDSRLGRLLCDAGCGSLDEYRRSWSACFAAEGERTHLLREVDLVLDGRSEADWEALALVAAGTVRLESLDAVGPAAELPLADIARMEDEIASLQAAKQATLTALERARGRLDQLQTAGLEDRWTLSADHDEAIRRADDLEIEQLALTEAISCMEASLLEVQGSLVPGVCKRAGELLASITDGRYGEVRMASERSDIAITVRDPRTDRWVEPEALSTGTRDQIYISLRIALAEHLTGRPSLPFILDDPFVHFDEERLSCTIRTLHTLGRTHQVVWLIKDRTLADRCTGQCPVIEL